MNAFHIHFPWFVVSCVFVAIIFLQREFPGVTNNHYITGDTTTKVIPVTVHGPTKTIFVPVPAIVDTQAILRNYFAENIYSQTVSDSLFSATITDTIQQNRLKGRGFHYKITRKEIVQEKFKVFAGLNVGAGKNGFASLEPQVYILTKKDHLYGVGYNVIDNSVNIKAGWKLSFK